MAGKEAGFARLKLNGTDWGTRDASIEQFGGFEAQSTTASGRVSGWVDNPIPCRLSATLMINADTDIDEIRNFSGIAEFELNTGQTYSTREARVTNTGSLTVGADGGVAVTIEGQPAERTA